MKIPAIWQREIEAGTAFGNRVREGLKTANEPRRPRIVRRTGYGDALAKIISRETGEQTDCTGCKNEIAALNVMSRKEVLDQIDALAFRIRNRAQTNSRAWWQRLGCTIAPSIVESLIRGWILEAIGSESQPPVQIDFEPITTRHLTYHVYPTKHQEGWIWNLKQLVQRASLFENGKRILAIATDSQTHDASRVVDFCHQIGLSWTHVVTKTNSRALREVQTWIPMLEEINPPACSDNEAVFSAHAKGVRHGVMEKHITAWADLMYRSCLDDIEAVEIELSKYLATGSFKRYGHFRTAGNHRWHYSGTFFWWRPSAVAGRNWKKVDRRFFGTESWLGHQASADETGCLFLDNCQDLYQAKYWEDVVWPAWEKSIWMKASSLASLT